MIRVLLVDDQALIRESLELMLNLKDGIAVVGTASDGNQALSLAAELQPDIILMDVRMPGLDGVSCIEQLRVDRPTINIIVLSTFDDDEYVFRSLRAGARAYLLKSIPMDELVAAIRTVQAGGAIMDPDVASKVFAHFSKGGVDTLGKGTPAKASDSQPQTVALENRSSVDSQRPITRSEQGIISLIAAGFSNKEITSRLNLSEGTVRNYISSILLKLGLRDRTQIAIWAVRNGYDPSDNQPAGQP